MQSNIIFGPVASRRLGVSLGIDIIPPKICPFDCIYCELGRTTKKTVVREEYVPADTVDRAMEDFFAEEISHLGYVTFSGSGEPTLHSKIGHFIDKVKGLTETDVAVITNSSLLHDPHVRGDLIGADLIVPSLDAATQDTFGRINRPVRGLKIDTVIEGIRLLVRQFSGEVWLEILIVDGINDGPAEIEALARAADRIGADRIQIGTVVRPPADAGARAITDDRLAEIASRFEGKVEIIPMYRGTAERDSNRSQAERIVAMLRIRPETLDELSGSLGMNRIEILKCVDALRREHVVQEIEFEGRSYYTLGW